MNPNDIRDKLDRNNFTPIRVHLSDGSNYDITVPGNAFVVRTEMMIGVEPDGSGLPTKTIYVDPQHVTRIEPLESAKPQASPRGT